MVLPKKLINLKQWRRRNFLITDARNEEDYKNVLFFHSNDARKNLLILLRCA